MSTPREEKLLNIVYDLEQRLEIALLCANQVWWEWDIPTGILKTHAIKDCILGYDLDKIRHHLDFWMDALPPEEREPVWQSLQEHLDGKTEMWVLEHRYKNPQGEYKWVLEAGKVITHKPDGSPLRMVGITQNIHDKKLKDQELKQKNEKLMEALKLKDLVLAGASHDMKNMLSSGYGFAQLLADEEIGTTKEFSVIEESLRRSFELVSRIQEMANESFQEVDFEKEDIASIIKASRDLHVLLANEKGLELRVAPKPENFVLIQGQTLRRIIDNLVGNALKFTNAGYVSINDLSDSQTIIIEVCDSGPGIPSEKTDLLFTPFVQLSADNSGSGLGLNISQKLAKEMGGEITYRQNTPSGSVFRVEIPRTKSEAEQE